MSKSIYNNNSSDKIDAILFSRIYDRYVALCDDIDIDAHAPQELLSSFEQANRAYRLDLNKLVQFDDFSFAHDIFNIYNSVTEVRTRTTQRDHYKISYEFNKSFVPRCAKTL